ncbi:unnamed protein product [Linum tenue]|uniref:Uncharacterized protein n=1 Tax=Linum tenue TaxID=586396 RepID=A0AAV0NQE8_9ROSI|nr:unnamed protein product [Linum tenue]
MVMTVDDGEKVKCYINSTAQPRASLAFRITNLDARPAPAVTDFSSRGPSLTCPSVLKPDIMGPGFLILAAWPPNVGRYTNFNIVSGTSMACPHLAGVGALLKKAHPDWSPAAVRSAIMTTADTTDLSGGPIQDSNPAHHGPAATGFAMGAGQVNPNKALHPGLVYDLGSSDYVNLLCAMNFTANQIRAITRSVTDCSSSSAPSSDLNYPSFVAVFSANRSDHVLELRRTLTNVDDDQEIMATYYEAHVTALDGFKVRVVPEKLVFKCKGDEQSFKLVLEMESHLKEEDNKPFLRSGYLKWIQVGGSKRVVQSPVVATNINSFF